MSKTILLADDSVTIQKVIELTFMDQDCEVVAVSTGDDAVERLGEMTPDLVIADVHMPGADGYEVARQSKQSHPGVPVLLLVGTFEPFDEEEMSASGADSHLKKPFDSQELLQLVERLMESAEAAAPETTPEEKPEAPPGPRPVPEPLSAEPSPAPAEEAAPAEVPAPEPAGAETVRLDSLDLEAEELRLGDESEAASAAPSSAPEAAEEVTAEPAAGTAGRDVTWGNLDLEAVEEEEASGSTEVEAPADATPLSEQDAAGGPAEEAQRTEPFRLSEPDSEELTLEPEPASEAPEPVAAQAVPAEPSAPEPTPPEPPPAEPAASRPAAPAPPAEPPAAAEPVETPAAPPASAASAATGLSDQDVERIARRVAELVGEQAVKDVVWEIVPDLAEVVIKDRIQQLESQAEGAET